MKIGVNAFMSCSVADHLRPSGAPSAALSKKLLQWEMASTSSPSLLAGCFAAALDHPSSFGNAVTVNAASKAARILAHIPTADRDVQNYDVYVLNVLGLSARLRSIARQLERANLTAAKVVPAFFGDDLNLRALRGLGLCRSSLLGMRHAGRTAAVALSHMMLWHYIQTHRRPAVVLEDDVLLGARFVSVVDELLASDAGRSADIVSLAWSKHMTAPSCVKPLASYGGAQHGVGHLGQALIRLECPHGLNPGTVAYLISPRGAARALRAALPLHREIDLQLGQHSAHLRWLALRDVVDEIASHNASAPSLRVANDIARSAWA